MTFDGGVVYQGGFNEGKFHGSATITFPNASRFLTEWHLNVLQTAAFFFADGLAYPVLTAPNSTPPSAWSFCTDADRRFASELTRGISLAPLGESQLTDKPGRSLPYQFYDVGDGYLDPTTGTVWGWEGRTQIRQADEVEVEWAKTKCRIGRDEQFTHNSTPPPES